MLVLKRTVGEIVRIGGEIQVCVIGIEGSRVRLGFSAPRNIPVHREEIYQRIVEKSLSSLDYSTESIDEERLEQLIEHLGPHEQALRNYFNGEEVE